MAEKEKRAIELLAGEEKKNAFERLKDIVKLIISILMGVAFNAALILCSATVL